MHEGAVLAAKLAAWVYNPDPLKLPRGCQSHEDQVHLQGPGSLLTDRKAVHTFSVRALLQVLRAQLSGSQSARATDHGCLRDV